MSATPYQTTHKDGLQYPGSNGKAGVAPIPFYIPLADLANAAIITAYKPGYKFQIVQVDFVVEKAVTTAAKAATITPSISGTNVTGGVLALTSANCTPAGTVVAGSAVTGANTGSATDTITFTGSSVTTFVEGDGWMVVQLRNCDDLDGF